MSKITLPSDAQARRLAGLFADPTRNVADSEHVTVTDKSLIKNGWVSPSGETGIYPNGVQYSIHKLSPLGQDALEHYLFDRRCKRGGP